MERWGIKILNLVQEFKMIEINGEEIIMLDGYRKYTIEKIDLETDVELRKLCIGERDMYNNL